MNDNDPATLPRRWAHLRHSVIGPLLASPPEQGELQQAIKQLARKHWRHPVTGAWITFGASKIERWLYRTRKAADPIAALTTSVRSDAGTSRAMSPEQLAALESQYFAHRRWSYQLHADNLRALCEMTAELGKAPSYSTVRRRMLERDWRPRRVPRKATEAQIKASVRRDELEIRSFESSHVHALWHFDFHEGSRSVIDAAGGWHKPQMLAFIDDRSRLCCHAQWYLNESAENLVHGLMQACHKRGLPRAVMHDNGSAMRAAETLNGLRDNGIESQPILAHSPYQNGKGETFWSQVEGRLLPMLDSVDPLRLDVLNLATQAWVEQEYNRTRHSEIRTTPLKRMLEGPDVSRKAPITASFRQTFAMAQRRVQRRSDGTVSIDGVRFEVPARLRTLAKPWIRWQRWDLSVAYIVCERTHAVLASVHPIDKEKNADGRRRRVEPIEVARPGPAATPGPDSSDPFPPLMRKYLEQYAATGLPPAYLPKDQRKLDAITPKDKTQENDNV